jgi:hypothetical protein
MADKKPMITGGDPYKPPSGSQPSYLSTDNAPKGLEGLDKLEVDPDHLDNVATYLNDLATYLRQKLKPKVESIGVAMDVTLTGAGGAATPSSTGGTQFGGPTNVKGASALNTKHGTVANAVYGDLKTLADSFDTAATATREMAKKYRNAEQLNEANAQDIMKAFANAAGNGSDSEKT